MHEKNTVARSGASVGDQLRAFASRLGDGFRKRGVHVFETPRPPREVIYRSATIAMPGGAQRTVALKQLSTTGARLEFHSREPLPDRFVLIEPIRGLRRRVRVVWQDDFVAGVAFVDN